MHESIYFSELVVTYRSNDSKTTTRWQLFLLMHQQVKFKCKCFLDFYIFLSIIPFYNILFTIVLWANNNNQNNDKVERKLNWLKEKSARYVPHMEFLTRCIENNLIPKEVELSLEPTIGNFDQAFISKWYSQIWKSFSFILMKDTVPFCGKTIEKTAKSIDETQIKLKQNLDKDEYDVIQNTIQIHEKGIKKTLQQYKFKKYN